MPDIKMGQYASQCACLFGPLNIQQ